MMRSVGRWLHTLRRGRIAALLDGPVPESEVAGLIVCDSRWMVCAANRRAAKLLGVTPEQAAGRPIDSLFRTESTEGGLEALRHGTVTELDVSCVRPDGKALELGLTVAPLTGIWRARVVEVRDLRARRLEAASHRLAISLAVAVGEAADLEGALGAMVRNICEAGDWAFGQAWLPNEGQTALTCSGGWASRADGLSKIRVVSEVTRFAPGQGLPGRVWASRQSAVRRDTGETSASPRWWLARELGIKAGLAFPVSVGAEVVAVMEFFSLDHRQDDEIRLQSIAAAAAVVGPILLRRREEERIRKRVIELAQSREAWKKEAALMQAATFASADGVVLVDEAGAPVLVNDYASRLLGLPSRGMVNGMRALDATDHPAPAAFLLSDGSTPAPPILDLLHRALRGEAMDGERMVKPSDGSRRRWFHVAVEPLTGANGTPAGGVAFFRDVTASKDADLELRRRLELLADAEHLAHVGGWLWDVTDGTLACSDEMAHLLGAPVGQPLTTWAAFLAIIHPDDREQLRSHVSAAVEEGVGFTLEHRLRWPTGEERLVCTRCEVRTDRAAGKVRILGTAQDLTDTRWAEAALRVGPGRADATTALTPPPPIERRRPPSPPSPMTAQA